MKIPGPDHPITYTPNPSRVRARYEDVVIADTTGAVTCQEANYAPVTYFPREDVETGYMSKTADVSTCPYKGQATYYSILREGRLIEKAAWSYEAPYPSAEAIKGMLAFYPDKLEIYAVDEADLDARRHPAVE